MNSAYLLGQSADSVKFLRFYKEFVAISQNSTNTCLEMIASILNSSDMEKIQSKVKSTLLLLQSQHKNLKSLPQSSNDTHFYNLSFRILKRWENKIKEMDLYLSKYGKSNWNEFSLKVFYLNLNTGAESNKLSDDLNKTSYAICEKYGIKTTDQTTKINNIKAYNIASDHYSKNVFIYLKIIIAYNKVLEAINQQDLTQLKNQKNYFAKLLDTATNAINNLKGFSDSTLYLQTGKLVKTFKKINGQEISNIANLFNNSIENENEIKLLDDNIKAMNTKSQETLQKFGTVMAIFLQNAIQKMQQE